MSSASEVELEPGDILDPRGHTRVGKPRKPLNYTIPSEYQLFGSLTW
jgi:hypothetical protein